MTQLNRLDDGQVAATQLKKVKHNLLVQHGWLRWHLCVLLRLTVS